MFDMLKDGVIDWLVEENTNKKLNVSNFFDHKGKRSLEAKPLRPASKHKTSTHDTHISVTNISICEVAVLMKSYGTQTR